MNPLRHALRQLARAPWFAVTAIGSVGLAIGLAGSVVSIVHAAFFTPLPYEDADRLVEIWQTENPSSDQAQDYLQPIRVSEWVSAETRHLESVAGAGLGTPMRLARADGPVSVEAMPVVGDWFGILGVAARRGRPLHPDDLRPDSERAAVVSQAFEKAWLNDQGLGSVLDLSGTSYTVVGVMPRAFDTRDRLWISAESLPEGLRPKAYAGIGRLRRGSTLQDASVEVRQMAATQVAADSALFGGMGATARPMGWLAKRPNKPMLWLLAGVVSAVVLLGLCNLTQIFLVNAQRRAPALAVRASLGGTPWQIGKDLLAEAGIIGCLGAALGLGLAYWGKDLAKLLLRGEHVLPSEPILGWPVLLLALGLGALTALVIGAEPLRRLGGLDIQAALQARAAGSGTSPASRRSRNGMVAVQVAICLVLAASVTVVRSAYQALGEVDVGVDADQVVQAVPDYSLAGLDRRDQWETAHLVLDRLRTRSEIAEAASWQPIGADYPPRPEFEVVTDGPAQTFEAQDGLHRFLEVTPGFFSALGIELVRGRTFNQGDNRGEALVAVVTERAARLWWPDADPLGRQVKLGEAGRWRTVVGVVTDFQDLDFLGRSSASRSRTPPQLIVPASQMEALPPGWRVYPLRGEVALAGRAAGSTAAAARVLREETALIAPNLKISRLGTVYDLQMGGYPGASMAMTGQLVAAGTVAALLLAILGIVGIVVEGLSRRTREIGVRIALGAKAHQVAGLVARESLVTAAVGVILGLALLAALDQTLSAVVFDYSVRRLGPGVLAPTTIGISSALVTLVTAGTTFLIARRAARVQPTVALRSD